MAEIMYGMRKDWHRGFVVDSPHAHHIAEKDGKLLVPLSLPPGPWDYRQEPPGLAYNLLMK